MICIYSCYTVCGRSLERDWRITLEIQMLWVGVVSLRVELLLAPDRYTLLWYTNTHIVISVTVGGIKTTDTTYVLQHLIYIQSNLRITPGQVMRQHDLATEA